MLMILEFYNEYIIILTNYTKIENICFHQEPYTTDHYCWDNDT